MSKTLTYSPQSSELQSIYPITNPDDLQHQQLVNKFNDLSESPAAPVNQAIQDNGGNLNPFGTDLTHTPAYTEQESRVKAMLYDPVNLGGQAEQAVANSQKTTDSQAYRDQVAAFAAVSHLTGTPLNDVVDNFGFYQAALEKNYGFDPSDDVGTFRKNLQGLFEKHDARTAAIDNLKSQAIRDAFEDADKGMSVPSLTRFENWQKTHEDALKGLPESDRLNAFNSVYKPIQQALNTPDGQLAKRFVDAVAGKTKPVEGATENASPEFQQQIDPKQFIKGLTPEHQTAVLSIAQQYFKSVYGKSKGGVLDEMYALQKSFTSSAESFNRYDDVHNLLDLESRRDAAVDPEEKQKLSDQYNDIILAQKVRQFSQATFDAAPVHYGWKGSVSHIAHGISGMIPQVAPFIVPQIGTAAYGMNEIANQTLQRMQDNPNMSAREAYERSIVPAAVATTIATKGILLLGKVAPTVVGALKHIAGATVFLSTAEGVKTLYAQLENAWNKDINAGRDFAEEYWGILKEMPYMFAELGILGAAGHVLSRGGKVDPEVEKQAAKNAADPMALKEQGFSHEEATRIAELHESERVQAIKDGWDKRTKEDIELGKQLQKDNNQKIVDAIQAPDAPKLVNNFDGTFTVTTVDAEGKEHPATFTDKDAAQTAYTMAMQDHMLEKQAKEEKEGNDWMGATAEEREGGLTLKQEDENLKPYERVPATAEGREAGDAIDRLNRSSKAQAKINGEPVALRVAPASPDSVRRLADNEQYQLAEGIAAIFNKKIVPYETVEGGTPQGLVNTLPELANKYIFLKAAQQARPHLVTLDHELWHSLTANRPDLADSARSQLLDLVNDESLIHQEKAHYPEAQRFDEVIGDFLSQSMNKPAFWDNLAQKSPELFKELGQYVKAWLDKVIEKLQAWNLGENQHFNDIEKAQSILADALHKWAIEENPNAATIPESTDQIGQNFQQRDKEEPVSGFYSQLQKTVADKMPNKASVSQIRAIIDPAKGLGVKPDEIKWSNLEGFLEGKKTVTKQEVLDYLKNEGAVKFEENRLGEPIKLTSEDLDRLAFLEKENEKTPLGAINDRLGDGSFQELLKLQNLRDGSSEQGLMAAQEEYEKEAQKAQRQGNKVAADRFWKLANHMTARAEELAYNRGGIENPTKYGQYVLPNGENYREVVLTMPEKITDWKKEGYYAKAQGDGLYKIFDFNDEDLGSSYASSPEEAVNDYMMQYGTQYTAHGYRSSHFQDIPNYVAHMRLDERKDASGRDGLFIEEIQSDRHQQAREKGYREDEQAKINSWKQRYIEVVGKVDSLKESLTQKYGTWDFIKRLNDQEKAQWESLNNEANKLAHEDKVPSDLSIPDAPFRKDWSIQMFKRALRDAVASGKDWIGWTSGDTQVDRFDLSKSVQAISYRQKDGELQAKGTDGGRAISKSGVTPEKLESFVGKEVAQKLLDQPKGAHFSNHDGMGMGWHTLSGESLKVGGEGMKGFYDQILPKEIGKYVKKWGAKVEQSDLGDGGKYMVQLDNGKVRNFDTKELAETYLNNNVLDGRIKAEAKPSTSIWKVSITPEMADSIKEVGQTLFQKNQPIIKGQTPPPPTLREKTAESLKRLKGTMRDLPAASPFKQSLLKWSARSQRSTNDIERAQHDIEKVAPQKETREGITNWIEAGGDKSLLKLRANATTDPKLKAGYEAALKFTPEQEKLAGKIQQTFDVLKKRAEAYGIEMGYRDNYVPHVYKTEPQAPSGSTPKRLDEFFKFSQERTFDTYHEGEQNGYEPETKDIAKLLGLYMNDMNNAINSRRFVEELRGLKASDGRPIVSPRGMGKDTVTDKGTTHLVYPDASDEGTSDYKTLDQPALHDWKFAGKNADGNMVLTLGDLAVHPEVASHLNNALSSSAISKWINARGENPFLNLTKSTIGGAIKLQSYFKGTMLSLSPFHQAQEGIHAIGHRVSPFAFGDKGLQKFNPFGGFKEIDFRDPQQADAAAHGLMLAHDRLSQSLFMEGVGDNNSNLVTMAARKSFDNRVSNALIPKELRKIGWGMTNWAADKVDAYQHWLFSQYIPNLKFHTYLHMLERNKDRYKSELASGKVSEWQVKNLTARQANAAYGHLNYTDMGHNPTIRHAFQLILLAPDFLEARSRFVGQAVKGLSGGKVGAEQLQALAFLAIIQSVGASIIKKLINDDYEFDHPFEIRVGNKYYGLRSVPEDIYKLVKQPTAFIGGRISPLFGKFVQEGVFGVNYRGERTSVGDAIADIMASVVPMAFQPLVSEWTATGRAHDLSWWEQVLASGGVQIHRYSPITKVYPMAHDWVKKNYPEDVQKGSYPVSKYQQLRYALEDGDAEKAQHEIDKLVEGGMKKHDVATGFRSSVNHPFTGSIKHDKEFYKSLDEDDQQRYKAAVERRKEILRRFHGLHGVPAAEPESPTE